MIPTLPLTFSPGMVRAMLDGRKTQTRRVLETQLTPVEGGPIPEWRLGESASAPVFDRESLNWHAADITRYGATTIRWVREAWRTEARFDAVKPGSLPAGAALMFEADVRLHGEPPAQVRARFGKLRNPRFMPRRLSRLTLSMARIEIQRLQDITDEDAIAEGLLGLTKDGTTVKYGLPDLDGLPGSDDVGMDWADWNTDPRAAYRTVWDTLNARRGYGWDTNPWVAVLHFTPIPRNVDAVLQERAA